MRKSLTACFNRAISARALSASFWACSAILFCSSASLFLLYNSLSNFLISCLCTLLLFDAAGFATTLPLNFHPSLRNFSLFFLVPLETYVAADKRNAVFLFFFLAAITNGSGMLQGSKFFKPTPAIHNSTLALRNKKSESTRVGSLRGAALTATKRTVGSFLAAKICSPNRVKVDLGPNSTKTRAPLAYMFSI